MGWDATGVDLSDVAVKQAKAKAAQPNELLRDFHAIGVLRYEDTEDEAIRFVAEKDR